MAMLPAMLAGFLRTAAGPTDCRPDHRLLSDYFAYRDEAAFAEIVRRHQRTVWGVCRRFCSNPADAEDAFQATFLILVRRGRTLADRVTVGGWLYRVAFRVSHKARAMAITRRRKEREKIPAVTGLTEVPDADFWRAVGEELDRLPENYRLAVILCDLDGSSRADASARLGWNEGTLSTRLHRGRKKLAAALQARGITAPALAFAALGAAASAPASVLATTIESVTTGNSPGSVALLVRTTWSEMTMTTIAKWPILLAAGVLMTALGGILGADPGPVQQSKVGTRLKAPVPVEKQPVWMANFRKTYSLDDGEYAKVVQKPYIPERKEFLFDHFGKKGWKPEDNGTRIWITMGALFLEDNGKSVTFRTMLSTRAADERPNKNPDVQVRKKRLNLSSVISCCTGLAGPEVDYDKRALEQAVFMEGDLVVRKDAPLAKLLPDLQKAIGLCELDIHTAAPVLTLKEEEHEVYVVSGKFELKPRSWREKNEVDVYADEERVVKGYNHKTNEDDLTIHTISYHSSSPATFLRTVGSFLNKRMVWDAEMASVPKFHWYLHALWDNNGTADERKADHDPDKVLKNVSEQTGLTFKKEKRKVTVLYVTVPEKK